MTCSVGPVFWPNILEQVTCSFRQIGQHWLDLVELQRGTDAEQVVHFTLLSTELPCSLQFYQSLCVEKTSAVSGDNIISPTLRFC